MEADVVVIVLDIQMCHEDKQQGVIVVETVAPQLGGEHGVPDLLKQILGLLVIVFLIHQSGETVEECLSVRHRFGLVDVRLIPAERFQHVGRHTIAQRIAAA